MERIAFAKKALQTVWAAFSKYFDAKADCDYLYSQLLIDEPTMDMIRSAKTNKEANQDFLTYLKAIASIESLMKFCEVILRDTQSDHPSYVHLATMLENELKKWNPEDLIEPIRIAPSGSNGPRPRQAVAGNSVGYSTPHSGHSQLGQISSCQPPSMARQDTSLSDPRKKPYYRFAIMVANDNELHATMHFLGSKHRWFEVKEDVQTYTCEGDEKLRGAITTEEVFSTQGQYKLEIFPITVDKIQGIIVKCGTMGSFTQMGSHRTTLQLMKEAKERDWDLKTIFIVGCCGTLPETETNVCEKYGIANEENEQGDSESPPAKKAKTKANIVSNPTVHHNKPNEDVPLGTVLVAREIFQYAMGKLEDGRTDWKPECCFKPDQFVDLKATQRYSDVGSDACRIVKRVKSATFLSADFVIKGRDTALELGKLHRRAYVGFEMEGVGATKAVDDALIFLPGKPEVVLVKGVSDKAEQYKNKKASFQFFSGEFKLRTEDCRQQMCAIMSLTLVLKYIIQNKATYQ